MEITAKKAFTLLLMVEQAVNLLDGNAVEDTIHLLPRTMKLLKLDIGTTHSERRTPYGGGK
ncbi:hypothetical protein [Paenibacillus sp. NPDC093718]|uniref:hypothetical protein n=1 Tax=Paenibacillus sp. NPDC093718 TaxID=3390601 RepID=UPI003D0096C3